MSTKDSRLLKKQCKRVRDDMKKLRKLGAAANDERLKKTKKAMKRYTEHCLNETRELKRKGAVQISFGKQGVRFFNAADEEVFPKTKKYPLNSTT